MNSLQLNKYYVYSTCQWTASHHVKFKPVPYILELVGILEHPFHDSRFGGKNKQYIKEYDLYEVWFPERTEAFRCKSWSYSFGGSMLLEPKINSKSSKSLNLNYILNIFKQIWWWILESWSSLTPLKCHTVMYITYDNNICFQHRSD